MSEALKPVTLDAVTAQMEREPLWSKARMWWRQLWCDCGLYYRVPNPPGRAHLLCMKCLKDDGEEAE